MIKKLQRRFIRIALVALAVAMVLVVLVVNAANWISVRNELIDTLSYLPQDGEHVGRDDIGSRMSGKNRHERNMVEESKWFSVSFDANGEQRDMNLQNMAGTDEETAVSLAATVLEQGKSTGFLQDYAYKVSRNPKGERTVLLLNCETRLTAVRNLALISALACLAGIALAFVFVVLASRKAIEPTIRNMEQQKQFITNASHELKTPLTVISTNMELLQMEQPDSQWVKSTQKQTAQMRHLVDELVYLSRLEEENAPLVMEDLNVAPLLEETAAPFIAMAEYQGKTMTAEADEMLMVRGDRASVQRLLSTLMDNSVKYASAEGSIRVSARAEGRYAVLTVSNDVDKPLTEEQCRQLFDRFYRADPSRNKDKQGGFGIGLAIAAAIAEGSRLVFTCRLPRGSRTA